MVSVSAIRSHYPQLVPLVDFEVRDDGAGPYLAKWPEGLAIPDQIEPGWAADARLRANNAAYTKATDALTTDYPQREKDTWPTQNEQAMAWVNDPENASTPWIDRAASERGIDREEYLRRTLVKAEQFKILSAFLTGRRQRYEDQIKKGGDPALDYALTQEVVAALKQAHDTVMNTPSSDMKAALA
jgi:hypothetical protein